MKSFRSGPHLFFLVVLSLLTVITGGAGALLGLCGPFTDVSDVGFCPFVLEIFTLGITTGTSPTTYDPGSSVSRLQMAAFLARTVDAILERGSFRTALGQFSTPQGALALTTVESLPALLKSDGKDVWVANSGNSSVSRVRVSDGKLLETWTGAASALGVLVAMGQVFVTGATDPGVLYRIDPSQPAGAASAVANNLGGGPLTIAFDGSRIWTANRGGAVGSVSIVTPTAGLPWPVTTVTNDFVVPYGVVYDSQNIWVTDFTAGTVAKLSSGGAVLQTVTLGGFLGFPAFDGTNIWVPGASPDSVSVVRAASGAILRTLTGNGLGFPQAAAFDGERVLVTNYSGDSVSLWKAADLTPLGFFSTGLETAPTGVCSDGVNFWITLGGTGQIARF